MWGKGASLFEFDGKSMETEITTWSQLFNEARAIFAQIELTQRIDTKDRTEQIRGWDLSRRVINMSKIVSDRKIIYNRIHLRSISSTRKCWPVLKIATEFSKTKKINNEIDWMNLIYVRLSVWA